MEAAGEDVEPEELAAFGVPERALAEAAGRRVEARGGAGSGHRGHGGGASAKRKTLRWR